MCGDWALIQSFRPCCSRLIIKRTQPRARTRQPKHSPDLALRMPPPQSNDFCFFVLNLAVGPRCVIIRGLFLLQFTRCIPCHNQIIANPIHKVPRECGGRSRVKPRGRNPANFPAGWKNFTTKQHDFSILPNLKLSCSPGFNVLSS